MPADSISKASILSVTLTKQNQNKQLSMVGQEKNDLLEVSLVIHTTAFSVLSKDELSETLQGLRSFKKILLNYGTFQPFSAHTSL